MQQFSHGHAAAENWHEAASSCLSQIGASRLSANLGFIYVTDMLTDSMAEILQYFREKTGVAHWVGTVGLGVCATSKEYMDEPAIAAMLGEFPDQSFRILPGCSTQQELAMQRLQCGTQSAHFGIVHGDPRSSEINELIDDLAQRVDSGFLVGGLTSSRNESLQIADHITHGGISGVIFSSEVKVSTRLSQGCSPIGPSHLVTQCRKNILLTLDGEPALDVFFEDIGEVLTRDLKRIGGYIFAGLPIAGSDTGDYLVRNLVGIDPANKAVAIGEIVEPGSQVMFCKRDSSSARDDMVRMLSSIKEGFANPPKGGLYYSCLGRGPSLFGPDSAEVKLIQDSLGEFPLVGFFCHGEISHNRLYGYTGVLTLFM